MDNVELVKQGYKDFAEGNMEAVLAVFARNSNGTVQ